jgi:hypothetical protein
LDPVHHHISVGPHPQGVSLAFIKPGKFSFGDEYDTPDPKVLAQKIGAYARGGNTLLTSPGCLECVVLNVCHGGEFAAELIHQGVPVVIAWETSVDNEAATVSSEQVNEGIHLYTHSLTRACHFLHVNPVYNAFSPYLP